MTFDAVLLFAMFAALVGAWWAGWLPQHYTARPLWLGFSVTAASVVFLIAGIAGFNLSGRMRFFSGTVWADGVIWWQVVAGLLVMPVAVYLLRRGVRDIDRRPSRS